jgi:hypothetical protein
MRKNTTPADASLEVILRRWPHLPEHVRKTLVELVGHYGPQAEMERFPTPMGAKWEDVEIVLLDDENVRITVGRISRTYTFSGLGLASQKHRHRPRTEWRMLKTYAENPAPDAYRRLPYRKNLKIDIARFRKWLLAFFGIPGDPLLPFATAKWMPRFKIRARSW